MIKNVHWRAEVGGKEQEWDTRITEQLPDNRIAWTSTSGDMNAGAVDFHRNSDDMTGITLTIDYDPQRFLESIGDALGFMDRSPPAHTRIDPPAAAQPVTRTA